MNKIIFIYTIFLISCGQPDKPNENFKDQTVTQNNSEMTLLDHVKLAINPKFQDWVLFENGTYLIFDNADTISDMEIEAIKLMKECGPVYAGSPAGDFSVTHLNKTEGWVVSGHCYGMYTYVNPAEIKTSAPSDVEIGLYGRSKRENDGNGLVVLHVNRKK